MKKNEVGMACGMYVGVEMCMQGFDGETRGQGTTWKTQA